MKKPFYQKLTLAVVILFILGVNVVAYFQYVASDKIAQGLHLAEPAQLSAIRNILNPVGLVTGIELLIGVLAIVLLIQQQLQTRRIMRTELGLKKTDKTHDSQTQQNDHKEDAGLQARLLTVTQVLQQRFEQPKLLFEKVLSTACREVEASQAALYVAGSQDEKRIIRLVAGYAFSQPESHTVVYEFGEGLAGQAAKEGKVITIQNVPQGYITVLSGLGKASPNALLLIPIQHEDHLVGLLEVASFHSFTATEEKLLIQTGSLLGTHLAALSQKMEIRSTHQGITEA